MSYEVIDWDPWEFKFVAATESDLFFIQDGSRLLRSKVS